VHIDPWQLSARIGVPVVPIVASRREGIGSLLDVVVNRLTPPNKAVQQEVGGTDMAPVPLGASIEQAILSVTAIMAEQGSAPDRLQAAAILERDGSVLARFSPDVQTRLLAIVE